MGLTFALTIAAQSSAAVAPSPPAVAKARLICRESEQETGSHIRTGRRCKTEAEWQQEDDAKGRKPVSARVTEGQGDAMKGDPGPH